MTKKLSLILSVLILSTAMLSAKGQVAEDAYENGDSLKNPGIYAKIDTIKGQMIFQLDYNNAPLTVMNFIKLSEEGFYEGLQFYRDIENYAIFSGDPKNDGSSDAGYNYPMEVNLSLTHDNKGILTMDAVSGMSNGSRFFITKTADPVLNEKYTAFGELVEGNKALASIKREMIINSIEIIRTGSDALAFDSSESEFTRLSSKALSSQLDTFRVEHPEEAAAVEMMGEGVQKTITGIYYNITSTGNGVRPEEGDTVSVHYVGMLVDGTVFDNSVTRGVPFEFSVGTKSVITGWDETVMAMTVGEKRNVLIPPSLAYGNNQAGPIPPGSWLLFEIEFLGIK